MIHHAATIESGAEISDSASIGAFCHIGSEVRIASGVTIDPHTTIDGRVVIGADTHIYPHTKIGNGFAPIEIGSECHIREFCHIGTSDTDTLHIRIKPNCYIMAYIQIEQGCTIESGCTIAIKATLQQNSKCETRAIIGASATVARDCTIGAGAMIGAFSTVQNSIPPFCLAEGHPKAQIRGLNTVGIKRTFESPESITALKRAFLTLKKASFNPNKASKLLNDIKDKQARLFVLFVAKHGVD